MQKYEYEVQRTLAEKYAIGLSRSSPFERALSLFTGGHSKLGGTKGSRSSDTAELRPNFKLELVDRFTSKFTGTHKFKYRLKYKDIPIYGSSVIVEQDDNGKVLFTDSSSADRDEVIEKKFPPSEPKIEKRKLPLCITEYYRKQGQSILLEGYDLDPSLHYYFEPYENGSSYKVGEWRLVYVTDIKANHTNKADHSRDRSLVNLEAMKDKGSVTLKDVIAPELFDYVIDAHTGEVVTRLSNIRTFC